MVMTAYVIMRNIVVLHVLKTSVTILVSGGTKYMKKRQFKGGCKMKVFDWDKAATLIKEKKPESAYAGLLEDMGYTVGHIYGDGKPDIDDYTYLASSWATPVIVLYFSKDHDLDGAYIPCYKMADEVPHWDAKTKWPESALNILTEEQ